MRKMLSFLVYGLVITNCLQAQITKAPDRAEGEGPYSQLIIRGVTLINGTGAPPIGPMDIVIEKNRIVQISGVGSPGAPINANRRPKLKEGGKELNCEGMYVLPGFIDMHGHIGGRAQGTPAEYVYKLWMGHGITTIRDPSAGNGLDWCLEAKKLSADNKITAPRIFAYTSFGQGAKQPISTPQQAIDWVRDNAKKGADGIKFFGAAPSIMDAAIRENKKLGLRSCCHHAQMDVARWNVLKSAHAGLTSMEHWYGLTEALFTDKTLQQYPLNYNYANEQHRFEEAGGLWKQAAPPYSQHWNNVMNELLQLDFMKCFLLMAAILFQFSAHAQYQVQKGNWFISHTAGAFEFTKATIKEFNDDEPENEYSTRQFGFRFGFSGPDWGFLEFGSNKNKNETSGYETDESGFSVFLQPQAGYFINDNLMIGASLSLGMETYKYDNPKDIGKGRYYELGIGPILRYYLGKNAKRKPFIGFESRFDITKQNDKTDYTAGQWMEYYEYDTKGSRVMIRPFVGHAWFLGKRWTADLRLDYTYGKETSKQESFFYVDRSLDSDYPQSHKLEQTYNIIGLSFGIGYTF